MTKIHKSEAIACPNPKCPIVTGSLREELERGAPSPICGMKRTVQQGTLAEFGRAEEDFPRVGIARSTRAMEIDDDCVIWAKQELADKPW